MNRRILLSVLLGFLALAMTPAGDIRAAESTEYEVKAAFLYNFAKFVTWPDDVFQSAGAPVEIGIVGTDPFEDALRKVVAEKTVSGRPIVIRNFSKPSEARFCHILFFTEGGGDFARALSKSGERGVLTVGEVDGFADHGGIIGFYVEEKRVRFEVNVGAADDADLRISSKLLSLARIIGDDHGKGGSR